MDSHPTSGIRVAIADPVAMARAGLSFWLQQEQDIHVVAETDSYDTLLESVAQNSPHVIFFDCNLPKVSWLESIKQINKYGFTSRILVMADVLVNVARKAQIAGAHGYLFKDETRDVFVSGVRNIAMGNGDFWLSDAARKYITKAAYEYESAQLTPMEKKVFSYIHHDNQKIADKLFLAAGTVRNHISSIYMRLNVANRSEAVTIAQRYGVLEVDDMLR